MDAVVIDVYRRLAHAHSCSVDDVLETPALRNDYLAETRRLLGDLPERRTPAQVDQPAKAEETPPLVRAYMNSSSRKCCGDPGS